MIESPVEVEAAKWVPYRRPTLRAVQLPSEVYSSCGGEGLWCNVLCRLRSLNFQYSDRVKPLEILTSLWMWPWSVVCAGRGVQCVHRVHRTVHNNGLQTVKGDHVIKVNELCKNVSSQFTVDKSGICSEQRWAQFGKKVLTTAISILFYLKKVSVKRLYRFKSQKFWAMKRYKYFYAKNLNRQCDCIVSNPGIFKGEAIQVFLRQKFWIGKTIVSFQKRLYRFKPQNFLRWSDTSTFRQKK